MRMTLAVAALTIASTSSTMALPIDPYRYCAERGDGGTNCYYLTLEQCQESVATKKGFCRENLFYNPGPGTAAPRSRRKR